MKPLILVLGLLLGGCQDAYGENELYEKTTISGYKSLEVSEIVIQTIAMEAG